MAEDFKSRLQAMPDAKKIAVAIYGESVAAYRYGLLSDKSDTPEHKRIFSEMRDEERDHQRALEHLAETHFPDGDFVLQPSDKELVIVGTRMLEITDAQSFKKAMQFLHDTERRTGDFYNAMHDLMPDGEIGRFLKEMADECVEHSLSLLEIEPPATPE
jgi:rubrerythrin